MSLASDFLRHGYELRSKIGSGSMGNVYLVFSKRYNLLFASKQILKNRHPQAIEENIPLSTNPLKKTNFQSNSPPSKPIEETEQNNNNKISDPLNPKINASKSTDIENINFRNTSIQQILNSDGDIISEESKNEIKSLMLLDHPNVVKIYEVFEEGDYLYIILEYCENNSLKDFVNMKEGKMLQGNELFNFVLQMTLAVQYCHSMKIVHRDIKPANFLLDHYYRIKLADFGLSMTNVDTNSNNDVKVCGSPAYMSPELLKHRKSNTLSKSSNNFFSMIDKDEPSFNGPIDLYKADIWALGINIYEIAAGRKPFVGTIDQIRLQVMHSFEKPNEIEESSLIKLLRGMLTINPKSRYTIEQIFTSEYFVKHGYSDSQYTANSSRIQLSLGRSPLTTSTPSSITPNIQCSSSHIANRNRSRCTNSTQSFFINRPTKITRNSGRHHNGPGSALGLNPIKSSRAQSIIVPQQQVSANINFSNPSNNLNYQESIYNQFADAQKVNSMENGPNTDLNAARISILKKKPNQFHNTLGMNQTDNSYDTDLSNSNSSMGSRGSDTGINEKPAASIKMKDVFAGIGSGRLLTSNSISKGPKNTPPLKVTQTTFK